LVELRIKPCTFGHLRAGCSLSCHDRIEGKDWGVDGHDRGCDVGQQPQMYVDEIKTQAVLPQLGSCAGVGRDLFGGIGPRQESRAALQAI